MMYNVYTMYKKQPVAAGAAGAEPSVTLGEVVAGAESGKLKAYSCISWARSLRSPLRGLGPGCGAGGAGGAGGRDH